MNKEEALLQVAELGLKPGDTVYTILRHVAKSGMMRRISLIVITAKNNGPFSPATAMAQQIDHIAAALGVASFKTVTRYSMSGDAYKDREEGLVVGGCGMDMGFELVYRLGRVLYPDGFCPNAAAIRPSDNTPVNLSIGRGAGDRGPLRKEEVESLVKRGWKFVGGRNGDTSGWDNDGGYAFNHKWL